jgi:hypothetical protein
VHGASAAYAISVAFQNMFADQVIAPRPAFDQSPILRYFRIDHMNTATEIHTVAAAAKPSQADRGTSNQTTSPNATSPTLPSAAPEASSATAALARFTARIPRSSFRLRSCFSTSVALAGNIAGNAKNRPPTMGPYRFAITPVRTVAIPPKPNRKTYSCHGLWLRADNLIETIKTYPRIKIFRQNAAISHTGIDTRVAAKAGISRRLMISRMAML